MLRDKLNLQAVHLIAKVNILSLRLLLLLIFDFIIPSFRCGYARNTGFKFTYERNSEINQ